jgi:hypothetical protein
MKRLIFIGNGLLWTLVAFFVQLYWIWFGKNIVVVHVLNLNMFIFCWIAYVIILIVFIFSWMSVFQQWLKDVKEYREND